MTRQLRLYSFAVSFALGITCITYTAAAQQSNHGTFTTIDFPGAASTGGLGEAFRINPRGDIVGPYTNADGSSHGFLLSGGKFSPIDFPGATSTFPYDINSRGKIVGSYTTNQPPQINPFGLGFDFHGFLLSGSSFTKIDFPGAVVTTAWGINQADILGSYFDGTTAHGYLLSGGSFTPIDFPGAGFTQALGINPQGDIVGDYFGADELPHGFLLRGGSFTTIDFPGAIFTFAIGISVRGDIGGVYSTDGIVVHGFLLNRGAFTTVDFPNAGGFTALLGFNPRGDITG
jgi:hypothetical protein